MATIQQVLSGKSSGVFTIPTDATVYAALEMMAQHNIGAVLVVENDQLRGIFSERDYARKGILKGKSSHETAVTELMTADVFTISPDTSVEQCMEFMTTHHFRHLPVLDDGKLIGLISIGDVVKTIIAEQEGQIQELHDYVTGNTY